MYDDILENKLKNKKKESTLKDIFNSQGLMESSFSVSNHSPQKDKNKITSKNLEIGISETLISLKDQKKFRRNSCHNFSGKTGFYVD